MNSLILVQVLFSLLTACTQHVISLDETAAKALTVGFALTVDRAVASVRYSNASLEDIIELKASEEYIELMQNFSSLSSQHPSKNPPYHSLEDMLDDWPRQAKRSARKRMGQPASPEVAIVADVLKTIADAAETYVGSPMSALVSFPALPGLYQEDIVDAASYIGLGTLGTGLEAAHPHENVVTYAGNGLGLYKYYNDTEKCRAEGKKLPARHTLLVEYTEAALLVHRSIMRESIELSWPHMTLATSFDLCSARSPGELDVQDFILQFLIQQYYRPAPDGPPDSITVMMTGSPESLSDGKVRKTTKLVIEALGAEAEILDENPGFKAARGAAELAWRALSLEERMEL